MAINVEEHTITQSVLALERPADWKALESFAEYGAWHHDRVTWTLTRLIETAPGRIWHGYQSRPSMTPRSIAAAPTSGGPVPSTRYTARCPNRLAPTVRAHNWVVLGALLHNPDQPAWFLPISGRLYFRKSQLPETRSPDGIVAVPDQVRTGRRVDPQKFGVSASFLPENMNGTPDFSDHS